MTQLKKAFRRVALESHPDKIGANAPPERLAAASNLFRAAKTAYDEVCARRQRRAATG